MKAVIFDGTGAVVDDVDEPRLQPGQLMLEPAFCGICGTDLHAAEPDYRVGTVMGHEFTATVLEVGAGVEGWRAGERVVINPNGGWCGLCSFCRSGQVNRCVELSKRTVGQAQPGGLAPMVALPAQYAYRLPDSVSLHDGAWVEPVAVALRAVRRSGAGLGDCAVVFGAGPIGLLITSLLVAAGVNDVTVVETSPERREKAAMVGAHAVLDPGTTDVLDHFADKSRAPQFGFECTGVAAVTSTAVAALRPGGRLTVSGFPRTPPSYRAQDLLFNEIEIVGSFIYVEEFPAAMQLLGRGVIDVQRLTSEVVPLLQAGRAFNDLRSDPSVVKQLITPTPDVSASNASPLNRAPAAAHRHTHPRRSSDGEPPDIAPPRLE